MAGVKRFRILGQSLFLGNENNEVTLDSRTTLRVTINGSDTVWERPAPNHKWAFEEASGAFVDSINSKELSDTDMVQRVPSMHPELGQAIELDAGFEVLTSKPYPIIAIDGLGVTADITKSQLLGQPVEGVELTPSISLSSLREPLITYNDGDPEGFEVTPSITLSDLRSVLISYDDGNPEGFEVTPSITLSDLRSVLISYADGNPEGFEVTPSITLSSLTGTASLLNFNEADGATSVTDETGEVWTASGNAQVDSSDKKFGAGSLILDGDGDYLESTTTGLVAVEGDFTIECFVKISSTGRNAIFTEYSGSSYGVSLTLGSSTQLQLVVSTGSYEYAVGTTTLSTGQWYHVAGVKEGSELRVYVDGVLDGSATITGSPARSSVTAKIGRDPLDLNRDVHGWVDSFRIVNGEAVYTSNFTPPTQELGIYQF